MKNNIATKLLAMAMALTVAVTAVPLTAQAAPVYSKSQVLYMTNSSSYTYTNISVNNLTKSQTIAKSSVKSDKKSVAVPYYLERSTSSYSYKTEYFSGSSPYSYSSNYYSYYIGLQLKKTGTAMISFKIKGISAAQKSQVTVKKYVNPVKSMKISGISGDLKSKTAKAAYVSGLKMTKTTKNATVKITPAKGWKISSAEVYDSANERYTRTYSYSKPMSSATLNVGTLTKNKSYSVYVTFVNSSNNAEIRCTYQIN